MRRSIAVLIAAAICLCSIPGAWADLSFDLIRSPDLRRVDPLYIRIICADVDDGDSVRGVFANAITNLRKDKDYKECVILKATYHRTGDEQKVIFLYVEKDRLPQHPQVLQESSY